jgi:hypothetical protein
MTTQSAVSIRAGVRDGSRSAVHEALAEAQRDVVAGTSSLGSVPGVHFSRLVYVPGGQDLAGATIPDSVLYTADVDGTAHQHVTALGERAGDVLDAVFGHCADYPETPDPARREAWLLAHEIPTAAHYVNTVGITVEQVLEEAALHEWLQTYLDRHQPELSTLPPGELHHEVRAVVSQTPALAFATRPARGLSTGQRLRAGAEVVAVVVVLVVLSPLLLLVAIPWLLAIRRLEKADVPWSRRPDLATVDALREQEDEFAYNPFAAMGFLKPGSLRRRTVRVVLRAVAFAVRHLFDRGSLAGVTTIHFARWVMLDDERRVIFTSCYDGSLESYMDDFIDKLAWGLNVVFSNGFGYPRTRWLVVGGARDEQRFKDYLRSHQLGAAVAYAAYPMLTTANITNNAAIRAGLGRELDDPQAARWLARL